jgi:hypothetical protein
MSATEYLKVFHAWERERAAAGGLLSEGAEERYSERLDQAWIAMTPAEVAHVRAAIDSPEPRDYIDLLATWVRLERDSGRLLDLRVYPDYGGLPHERAQAIYETVTGKRASVDITGTLI